MKYVLNVIIRNLQDNTCGQYLDSFDNIETRDKKFDKWVCLAKNLCSVGLIEEDRIIKNTDNGQIDEYTEVKEIISNANLRFVIMKFPY